MTDSKLVTANPNCYVCSPMPFVNVYVNVNLMTVGEFETEILRKNLNIMAPDVVLAGNSVVLISSEEGETEVYYNKTKMFIQLFLTFKI